MAEYVDLNIGNDAIFETVLRQAEVTNTSAKLDGDQMDVETYGITGSSRIIVDATERK